MNPLYSKNGPSARGAPRDSSALSPLHGALIELYSRRKGGIDGPTGSLMTQRDGRDQKAIHRRKTSEPYARLQKNPELPSHANRVLGIKTWGPGPFRARTR